MSTSFSVPRAPRAAIVTYAAQPNLYGEEQGLFPMLAALGVEAHAVRWDDPSADWASFDAVVLRSTWDYFQRFAEFRAWLDRVEPLARVYNPPALVRWNSDKLYLRDLERRGVRIVPTVFCEHGNPSRPHDLAAILRDASWDEAVIKPAVSGGAFRTHRVRRDRAEDLQREMDGILETTSVLVQPFLPEIQSEGEWSFFFFDGALSHTVLKTPAASDYRVQVEYGGTPREVQPEPWLVAQVDAVVRALPIPPAYARIDGVRRGRDFYLMEAELIEPYLFTAAAPGSLERYAALIARLARPA